MDEIHVPGHTFIVDTQDNNSDAHGGGEAGIEISIVNNGSVNIVDSSGNPISSREDDVIAVLGQLFESAEDTLQHMAQQMVSNSKQDTEDLKSAAVNGDRSRPHVCECGKSYTSKSHLKYHQKVHSNHRPYMCEFCDQTFLQLGHLKRHLRIHTKDKPFACDLCDKTFRQNSHLTCHRRIHTNEKPYACQVCGMGFRQKTAVFRHVSRMHVKDKDYRCSICNKGYSGEADLHRHVKTHVNITYFAVLNLQTNTSQICGHIEEDEHLIADDEPSQENKENNELDELGELEVIETFAIPPTAVPPVGAPRPFKCNLCSKTYKSKGHLKFHSKVHLSDRPFKCTYCSKGFIQKGHLRRHVLVHTEEKPYVCTVCEKVFRQVSHLNDHKKIHANLRPNVCYVCGKGFRQTSALKRHMIRMHATRKAFGCKLCGKKYRLESDLKRHQLNSCGKVKTKRKHKAQKEKFRIQNQNTDETVDEMTSADPAGPDVTLTRNGNKRAPYRYKCGICSKPCRSQTEVKIHLRTHTNERPFQCGICHNVFKLLPHLKDHMLIHTGERPFSCDICENKFRRDSALRRHVIRMHSKEKKHVCGVCPKAYASSVDLRRHRKSHIQDHEGLPKSHSNKKQKKHKYGKRKHRQGKHSCTNKLRDTESKEGGFIMEEAADEKQVEQITEVQSENSQELAKEDYLLAQILDTNSAYASSVDLRTHRESHIQDHEGLPQSHSNKKQKKHKYGKQKHRQGKHLCTNKLRDTESKEGGFVIEEAADEKQVEQIKEVQSENSQELPKEDDQLVQILDTNSDTTADGNFVVANAEEPGNIHLQVHTVMEVPGEVEEQVEEGDLLQLHRAITRSVEITEVRDHEETVREAQ